MTAFRFTGDLTATLIVRSRDCELTAENRGAVPTDAESRLLSDIAGIADKVRAIRASTTSYNSEKIKLLEAESRTKWTQLRTLRAGPINLDPLPTPNRRSPRS